MQWARKIISFLSLGLFVLMMVNVYVSIAQAQDSGALPPQGQVAPSQPLLGVPASPSPQSLGTGPEWWGHFQQSGAMTPMPFPSGSTDRANPNPTSAMPPPTVSPGTGPWRLSGGQTFQEQPFVPPVILGPQAPMYPASQPWSQGPDWWDRFKQPMTPSLTPGFPSGFGHPGSMPGPSGTPPTYSPRNPPLIAPPQPCP